MKPLGQRWVYNFGGLERGDEEFKYLLKYMEVRLED